MTNWETRAIIPSRIKRLSLSHKTKNFKPFFLLFILLYWAWRYMLLISLLKKMDPSAESLTHTLSQNLLTLGNAVMYVRAVFWCHGRVYKSPNRGGRWQQADWLQHSQSSYCVPSFLIGSFLWGRQETPIVRRSAKVRDNDFSAKGSRFCLSTITTEIISTTQKKVKASE